MWALCLPCATADAISAAAVATRAIILVGAGVALVGGCSALGRKGGRSLLPVCPAEGDTAFSFSPGEPARCGQMRMPARCGQMRLRSDAWFYREGNAGARPGICRTLPLIDPRTIYMTIYRSASLSAGHCP